MGGKTPQGAGAPGGGGAGTEGGGRGRERGGPAPQWGLGGEAGRVVGSLGPKGAGKTTTLRMLLGLATPPGGSATINGRPYQQLDQPLHTGGAVLDASAAIPGR